MVVRIQHEGNHNPSSTQKLGKGGSPGEENSICSSGEVAEAGRQTFSQEAAVPGDQDIHPIPPLQACVPEHPSSFCVLARAVAPPAVPGTQYVYR